MQSITTKYPNITEYARQIVRAELEAFHAKLELLLCKISKPVQEDLVTRKMAAHMLECNLSTLWRYTKDNRIRKIKRVGLVYYNKNEIINFKLQLLQDETNHALII